MLARLQSRQGKFFSLSNNNYYRYLTSNKKKYNLANVDQNIDQLKDQQIKELTNVLITLKSEYDNLVRDTSMKKRDTEQLGKQIIMLEKMEKKSKNRIQELEENSGNNEVYITIKKQKKEEELYTKNTLVHLVEKLKEEILIAKKEINDLEIEKGKKDKSLEMERIREHVIKEKINQIYSKIENVNKKNNFDGNENSLIMQYYNTVIEQKWSFINSSDERKEKQIKIAQEAKNDSQDKQEVEKRKILFLCTCYNKYLRRKMEKELKDNEKLEEIFTALKVLTVKHSGIIIF